MKSKILAVAPMMDWTDRHCRAFHRILSTQVVLYTEMVNSGAILYGDKSRHLDFSQGEHPVVLQLGGSEPEDLARAAKYGEEWGYDQIDLNCGCPSERVQRGSFGACLMAEPTLVSKCVQDMKDAVSIPVSVKHRLGLNDMDPDSNRSDYQFVLDFMLQIAQAGASQFTIHARNAVLKGLSPKENRSVPPLRYEIAKQLRIDLQREFPKVNVLLNGGLESSSDIARHWNDFDGFMVGRAAYHMPAILLGWDHMLASDGQEYGYFMNEQTWIRIQNALIAYSQAWLLECQASKGKKLFHMAAITRHILGLAHGLGGSRHWRQYLSDHRILSAVQTEQEIKDFFEISSRFLRIFSEQEESSLSFNQDD